MVDMRKRGELYRLKYNKFEKLYILMGFNIKGSVGQFKLNRPFMHQSLQSGP